MSETVFLDGASLTVDDVYAVAASPVPVRLAPAAPHLLRPA